MNPRLNAKLNAKTLGLNGPLPVFRLSGKVAIITGGGGQIGVETARRLLREGAKVTLVDIDEEALKAATRQLEKVLATGEYLHSRILTVVADVTVEKDVEMYTKRTVHNFGRLDCVFLGAGIPFAAQGAKTILETTEEDYERIMPLNIKSAFLGLKHAAAHMRDLGNGGSIVLASSIAGLRGTPGYVLEATSKSALNGLAQTAAGELGQFGIRVNTIHPSGLGSVLAKQADTPQELEEMRATIPLGRFAQVDDVASVVSFLASEDSKFMTGGDLKVDGGIIACEQISTPAATPVSTPAPVTPSF